MSTDQEVKNENWDEDEADLYNDANVYSYVVLQHSLAEEMTVQDFDDSTDRTLLSHLYILRENKWGLIAMTASSLAERLRDKEENIVQQLDALQRTGHIYRDGFFIILTDWRRYLGVNKAKRDIEGRMYVTKGMAKVIFSLWNRLSQKGQQKYLATCGLDSKADLIEIRKRPDNRGRPRLYKPEKNLDKTENNLKKNLDKTENKLKKYNNKKKKEENEDEGGRISENPPPSFSKNRTTEEMIRLLQDALFQEFRANPWDKQSSKWKGIHELCLLALGRVYNPDLSPVWKDRDFMLYAKELKGRLGVYGEETGLPPPYWLGNLCSPGFIDWLAKDDDAVMLFQRISDLKRSMPEYDGCSEPAQSAPPRRRAVPPDIGSSIDDLPEYVPQEDCPYEPNDGTPVIRVPDRSCSDHDPREDADSDAY